MKTFYSSFRTPHPSPAGSSGILVTLLVETFTFKNAAPSVELKASLKFAILIEAKTGAIVEPSHESCGRAAPIESLILNSGPIRLKLIPGEITSLLSLVNDQFIVSSTCNKIKNSIKL